MPPVRRYLRITEYSVLEVRIYLEVPALAQTWLLNPRDDVLTRIITAVRPHVFRQLWDDRNHVKSKGKKKKGVKDVAFGDDFEASIFLIDPSTRHSLLIKQKDFQKKTSRLQSNSSKLTGWLEKPTDVDVEPDVNPIMIPDESDDEAGPTLDQYPPSEGMRGSKRPHEGLFVEEDVSEDEGFQSLQAHTSKRSKVDEGEDDKKKLAARTSYDGFAIYGRILCLVVKRRGSAAKNGSTTNNATGQQMLETWVSTQAAQEQIVDDD